MRYLTSPEKIANRTVADEYFAVTDKVEALYGQPDPLPADAAGPKMTRMRREHYRMLGNGYCARPPQLDCAFESICETCTYFQPTIEFAPPCNANTTTPKPNSRPDDNSCSSTCSTNSTRPKHPDQLDKITCIMSLSARRCRRKPYRGGRADLSEDHSASEVGVTSHVTRTHVYRSHCGNQNDHSRH